MKKVFLLLAVCTAIDVLVMSYGAPETDKKLVV